jgi:hypothetical protein
LPKDSSGNDLEAEWKEWARREEMTRFVLNCKGRKMNAYGKPRVSLALQIHDAELSALLHREPLLKHIIPENQWQASGRAFSASSASKWAHAVQEDARLHAARAEIFGKRQLGDTFTAYVRLEGLGVMIADDRRQGHLDQAAFDNYQKNLIGWHEAFISVAGPEQPGQLCLVALWHWTFMALLVDFDQLESAIGRDGLEAAEDAITYASTWASTPNASRCMLHAFLIQKQLQGLSFDDVPAIHTPRIVFSAAIAWHCFIRYRRGNDTFESSIGLLNTDWPEIGVMGSVGIFAVTWKTQRQLASEMSFITNLSWKQGAESSIRANTLCELGGLLQRMSQWGLAGKFSNTVTRLIEDES